MPQFVDYLASQLGQGLSGSLGDYLGLLFASLGIVAALSRALNIFPMMRTELNFLLNPQVLTFSSVALWTNGNESSILHQHLTMLLFLVAMFLRFSGTCEDSQTAASLSSLIQRWFSRIGEYTILMFALPSFQSIARPHYVLPLLIFISTARSNEVFRAWNPDDGKCSPSEEDQMRKALEDLLPQSRSHIGNCQHQLQLQVRDKSLFQLGFLWLDGSGTLVIGALIVVVVSIVSMAGSVSLSHWLIICVEVLYVIAAVYICLQCLPALISRFDKFGVLLKDQNKEWLGEVKGWTSDMARFLKTITVSGGFPFKCNDLSKLGLIFAFVEGIELAPHVVVAALCRLLLHSLLLCIAWIVTKTLSLGHLLRSMRLINKLLKLLDVLPADPWIKTRHILWKFAATICAQEILTLKDLFQDPASFILIGVEFNEMDHHSEISFSKRKHGRIQIPRNARSTVVRNITDGYCWVEAEGTIGYGYLAGTFVQLSFSDGRENWGVVGGWISDGNVRSSEWGDSEYNQECCEKVGHFFGNLPWSAVFNGETAPTLQVWLKFGPKALRISHLWTNDTSKLGGCTCDPNPQDPNVKVLASNITSWPSLTTWKLALVSESLIDST